MAFKNAIKILINKFGLVWVVLLYFVMVTAVLAGLSVAYVIPVVRVFNDAGIGTRFVEIFNSIMNGETVSSWFVEIHDIVDACWGVLQTDFFRPDTAWMVVVAVLLLLIARFLFGWYELPLVAVLEGAMSSNARIGFTGRFISRLGHSCVFVLTKMIYTVLYDAVLVVILYFMFGLFEVKGLAMFAPFIIMLVLIALVAFRYTVICMWAPARIVGGKKLFPALFGGVGLTFKHFGSIYSSFLISHTLLIALNILVGLFTFGAGLLITVPVSVVFLNILNMTVYYNKTGRRYYTDASGTVYTPPTAAEEN